MKTDLRSLKKEFNKLTDLDYLKKEFNRVASEVKKLEVHVHITPHLTPAARLRLESLEKRFHELVHSIQELQKQVDTNLDKFIAMVRQKRDQKKAQKPSRRATTKSARSTTREAVRPTEPYTEPAEPAARKKKAASKKASVAKVNPPAKSEPTKLPKARKTKAK